MTTVFNPMKNTPSRILVLAPHTDDAELGCGGTIARLLEEGTEVFVAAFSIAEGSLPPDAVPTQLRDEFFSAMQCLGIGEEQLSVFRYPVRRLSEHRQDLLEEMVRLRQRIQPTMVLLPSSDDLHQDHQTVSAEGRRCFKEATIWGYELPWNDTGFASQAFVTLEQCHLQAKWKALQCYKSQILLGRPYFQWEFVESLARIRGIQMKVTFAESFEVVRLRC